MNLQELKKFIIDYGFKIDEEKDVILLENEWSFIEKNGHIWIINPNGTQIKSESLEQITSLLESFD